MKDKENMKGSFDVCQTVHPVPQENESSSTATREAWMFWITPSWRWSPHSGLQIAAVPNDKAKFENLIEVPGNPDRYLNTFKKKKENAAFESM